MLWDGHARLSCTSARNCYVEHLLVVVGLGLTRDCKSMALELGNSLDKLRHQRSYAYSAEVSLNKQQIWCGRAYPDCYPELERQTERTARYKIYMSTQ